MLFQLLTDHPEAALTIVQKTPHWVWGLLAALVLLGVSQLRTRRLAWRRAVAPAIGLALLLLLGWAHARENRRLSPPVSQIAQGFLILVGVAALFNSILYDHQDGHFYVIIAEALWSAGRSSPASRHPVP